jgi:hypothetical protein
VLLQFVINVKKRKKLAIGSKLLDINYKPEENISSDFGLYTSFKKIIKCPVKFTEDPIEYAESYIGFVLRPIQKNMIIDLFSTDENDYPLFDTLIAIQGMRSSKSVTAAIVISFLKMKLLAMDNPGKQLGQAPGQKLVAEFIATSEQQSKNTAYAALANIITSTDWWIKYISYLKQREESEGKETLFSMSQKRIAFPEKNVESLSLHSNSNSIAGFTAFGIVGDEWSRLSMISSGADTQSFTEARTAEAIWNTCSRAAKSIRPFSKVIIITSPLFSEDFGMKMLCRAGTLKAGKHKNYIEELRTRHPEKVKRMLGYYYTTLEVAGKCLENPNGFTEEDFESERSEMTAYMRDYECVPPETIASYFDRVDLISKCVHDRPVVATFTTHIFEENITTLRGVESRRYVGKQIHIATTDLMKKYFICCDQGEKKDAFVVCMGHGEEVDHTSINGAGKEVVMKKHKVIIDLIEAWEPDKENKITVSFQNVENTIQILSKNFFIHSVLFDQWQSTEAIQRLFSSGIHTEKIGATLEMYDIAKMLIYSDMVEFPPNDKLIHELRTLNLIKGRKIDHNENSSKDLADAFIRVIFKVYESSIKDSIQGTDMLPKGAMFLSARNLSGPEFNLMSYGGSMAGSGGGLWGNSSVFGNRDTIVSGNVTPSLDKFWK